MHVVRRIVVGFLVMAAFGIADVQAVCTISPTSASITPKLPFGQPLTPGGGVGPYILAIDSRSPVNAWLTLKDVALTGWMLSGAPPDAGPFTFDILITDDKGTCRDLAIQFTLGCPITVGPPSFPDGTTGEGYREAFKPNNTVSTPTIVAVDSKTLPPGLFIESNLLQGTPSRSGSYSFVVRTTDKDCSVDTTHQIKIFCPIITTLPALMPRGAVGAAYSTTLSALGGTPNYSFALALGSLPAGLTLSGAVISGTPTVAGDSTFTIRTTDQNACTDIRTYTLNVCPIITVSPQSLNDATVGLAFSSSFNASGGSAPYAYSIVGPVPAGMTFNAANGTLSGTPTAPGIFNFEIVAKDSGNCEGRTGYTLRVCPSISIAAMKGGTLKQSYREPLNASGGAFPYTFTLGKEPLPTGLSFDGASTISGTPTQTGTFPFTVQAKDANGCISVGQTSITITDAPCPTVSVSPSFVPNATAGSGYSVGFTGKGGAEPFSFSLIGTAPPGLVFKTDTLGGTPTTPGKFDFSIKVTDANGCTATQNYTLTVDQESCAVVGISPASLPNGTAGTAYPATAMTGTGGSAPHTISLRSGNSLPPGLALVGGQILAGTPTTAGTFRFELEVKDAKGCPGIASYSITIAPAADPCPTDGASLISPSSGAKFDGTKPIVFSWSEVKGATSYDLLLSDDGVIFSTAASTTTTSSSLTLKAGAFSWRVRAQFGADCKPVTSAISRFTVEPPPNCPTGVAKLLTPSNGSTITENPVIFAWDAVTGSIKYVLRASVNGGPFSTLISTTDTAVKLDVPEGQIAWFIESVFENCPSTQSQTSRFTFGKVSNCPTNPGSPVTISPTQGARDVTSPVLFQWSAVSGATLYRVMASLNEGAYVALGTTAATQLSASVPAGPVTWYVEALFGDCPSTVSNKASFTAVGAAQCNNSAATLIAPANGAANVASPVVFSWNEVKGAVEYRLFVSLAGKLELAATTGETSVKQLITEGSTVEWLVESVFLACPAIRSGSFRFTVAAAEKCAEVVTTVSPANGAKVTSPVTLRWNAVAGAIVYRVWASIDGGAPAPIAKSNATEVVVQIPSGVVEWYVEVIFERCPAIISDPAKFEVQRSSDCSRNAPPSLVSPLGQAAGPAPTTSPVEFRWLAAPNAVMYRLWVAGEKQPFGDLGFTKELSAKLELSPGNYQWFVEAFFEGCPSLSSSTTTFSVQSSFARCGSESPSLISPADGTTNVSSPVTFLWSSVSGAKEYRVLASLDGSELTLIASTTTTSVTQPVPPGVIVWIVEAVFEACPSTQSNKAQFTSRQASNCTSARPQTQSPADGADKVGQLVNFAWTPVSGAIKYVVIVRREDGSPTSAGSTDDTDLEVRLSDGKYEWFVLAFTAGCDPVESNHASFVIPAPPACDSRPPSLKAPANSATGIASPIRFEWSPVSRATSYKLWIVGSDGVPSLVATTTETGNFISLPGGVFEWYVVATFNDCPAIESARSKFSVASAPPPCQTPAKPRVELVGQALSGTVYSVRWSPVANATVYELQEATSPDFSDAVTLVRTDLSAPFVHEVSGEPKQYLYRVRAISSCNDLRSQYSDVIGVFIVPVNASDIQKKGSAEVGVLESLVQTVFIPGFSTPVQFTAATDRPWMTVTPSSGILPPEGLTLTLTADPATLFPGSNTATLLMTYGTGGKGVKSDGTPPINFAVSVSLVTPVGVGGKNTPPPDALIIPAVAHTLGANASVFESDVRVYNATSRPMTYQLNFTPAGVDGTLTGKSTTIQVEAGST
ncbi:MAG: putative Ig domain-containing protein, partial [Thermoanaerobaculia bacterium]|nr:putative Ig domain-containing protein [Thermoanaerobaculia bacterium]